MAHGLLTCPSGSEGCFPPGLGGLGPAPKRCWQGQQPWVATAGPAASGASAVWGQGSAPRSPHGPHSRSWASSAFRVKGTSGLILSVSSQGSCRRDRSPSLQEERQAHECRNHPDLGHLWASVSTFVKWVLLAGAPGPHWQWPSPCALARMAPSSAWAFSGARPRAGSLRGGYPGDPLRVASANCSSVVGIRAQPSPTVTPAGPAPGVLGGAHLPLPPFPGSPRTSLGIGASTSGLEGSQEPSG